jgi:hypothetical protein
MLTIGSNEPLLQHNFAIASRIEERLRCRNNRLQDRRSPLCGGVDRNQSCQASGSIQNCRPFAGAWIETAAVCHAVGKHFVAPLRGAWIETPVMCGCCVCWPSPLCGGVDRNSGKGAMRGAMMGSPLCGGVDRNLLSFRFFSVFGSSPLCGGVDRNASAEVYIPGENRRPFAGAWIETSPQQRADSRAGVAPLRGRGSKPHMVSRGGAPVSSPLCGGVDRNSRVGPAPHGKKVAPLRGRG